jgi:hypothetical protein
MAGPDTAGRAELTDENPSRIPVLPRAVSAVGVGDCLAPSARSEEPRLGVPGRASGPFAAAAASTSSRTSRAGATGSMSDGARETTSEMDSSGAANTGAASAAGATTLCDTVSATRSTAVSARDTTGAVTCAGKTSDDVRVPAAASTGATISLTTDGTYSAGAGAAPEGTALEGAARTGTADSPGWAAALIESTAFRACIVRPGLFVPLPAEAAGAVIPPSSVSGPGWVLASAAGAEKDSQATAAAPAMRTGRSGRSRDHGDILLAMLDTPRFANNSTIVYRLSLAESRSPEP